MSFMTFISIQYLLLDGHLISQVLILTLIELRHLSVKWLGLSGAT